MRLREGEKGMQLKMSLEAVMGLGPKQGMQVWLRGREWRHPQRWDGWVLEGENRESG